MTAAWELAGHRVLLLRGEAGLQPGTHYTSFTGDFGFWTRGPAASAIAMQVAREAPLLALFHTRVLNLEFILPGDQGRPADLACEATSMSLIRDLGFTHVSLANNHALAFRDEGLIRNRELLEASGVAVCGLRERPACMLDVDGTRMAIWSITDRMDEPDPAARVLRPNRRDLAHIAAATRDAKLSLCFAHLGSRSLYPSPREIRLAHRLLGSGPALLVCTGSHFVKGFVQTLRTPVCFGIGNHLLTWERGDTEPIGMHLVAGTCEGRLTQLFAIPFRNTIMQGTARALSAAEFADFASSLQDRSTLELRRFLGDPRLRAGIGARFRRLWSRGRPWRGQ